MAEGFLPPVIVQLLADTKEFQVQIDESMASLRELGGVADETAGQVDAAGDTVGKQGAAKVGLLSGAAGKLSTAVIGAGVAVGAFAVDEGYKFTESMDQLQNATGLSNKQLKALEGSIFSISDATGSATGDLAAAYAAIYQSGERGAKATQTLDVAAKAALATHTNVVDVTQALVAAQGLQVAKGKSVADLTGVLVAGSHDYVGGLQAEVSMLQGKVGTALANYHIGLKTSIELGSVFAKVGLPTRSIASFVNGLGKLEAPLTTVSDSTGHLEKGFSSYYEALKQVGLSQSKLESDLRTGNLAGLFTQIKDAAIQAHDPVSELFNVVFGSSAGAVANLLSKSPIKGITDAVSGAGAGSLNSAFTTATHQFGNQLHLIETNLVNAAAQFGLKLIPYLSDAATFVENALQSLETHPAERKALEIDLGTTFAAAIGLKIAQATQASTQTGLLADIARNTSLTAQEAGVIEGEGGVGDVEGFFGAATKFASAVGPFAIGAVALWNLHNVIKNPNSIGRGGLLNLVLGGPKPETGAGGSLLQVQDPFNKQILAVSQLQLSALNAAHLSNKQFSADLEKFASFDTNRTKNRGAIESLLGSLGLKKPAIRHTSANADILPKPTKKKSGTLTIKHTTLVGWTK